MAENGNGRIWRMVFDGGVFIAIVTLAFAAGQLWQSVSDLQTAVTTPGRVQISIEARERLTAVEQRASQCERRLDALERK